jgi:hypothetical protein
MIVIHAVGKDSEEFASVKLHCFKINKLLTQ